MKKRKHGKGQKVAKGRGKDESEKGDCVEQAEEDETKQLRGRPRSSLGGIKSKKSRCPTRKKNGEERALKKKSEAEGPQTVMEI